eukprot:9478414-Pyramimonas_sp.AAC.1
MTASRKKATLSGGELNSPVNSPDEWLIKGVMAAPSRTWSQVNGISKMVKSVYCTSLLQQTGNIFCLSKLFCLFPHETSRRRRNGTRRQQHRNVTKA